MSDTTSADTPTGAPSGSTPKIGIVREECRGSRRAEVDGWLPPRGFSTITYVSNRSTKDILEDLIRRYRTADKTEIVAAALKAFGRSRTPGFIASLAEAAGEVGGEHECAATCEECPAECVTGDVAPKALTITINRVPMLAELIDMRLRLMGATLEASQSLPASARVSIEDNLERTRELVKELAHAVREVS